MYGSIHTISSKAYQLKLRRLMAYVDDFKPGITSLEEFSLVDREALAYLRQPHGVSCTEILNLERQNSSPLVVGNPKGGIQA